MMKNRSLRVALWRSLCGVGMAAAIAGCAPAITESHVAEAQQHDPRDPYEGWNRGVQSFNDSLDDHVMKPIANGYQWIMPGFADKA